VGLLSAAPAPGLQGIITPQKIARDGDSHSGSYKLYRIICGPGPGLLKARGGGRRAARRALRPS
jgi:hypothetical protein